MTIFYVIGSLVIGGAAGAAFGYIYRKNIQEKTGIKSLSGLAVYAILNGYVRLEDL